MLERLFSLHQYRRIITSFYSSFPLKHPTAKTGMMPSKYWKICRGVKQLNLLTSAKPNSPANYFDLVGKLSLSKNIPPFKRAETPNHKHPGRTNFSIRPNEWAFFLSTMILRVSETLRTMAVWYTIGNYAVSSWFRRPLETMSEWWHECRLQCMNIKDHQLGSPKPTTFANNSQYSAPGAWAVSIGASWSP